MIDTNCNIEYKITLEELKTKIMDYLKSDTDGMPIQKEPYAFHIDAANKEIVTYNKMVSDDFIDNYGIIRYPIDEIFKATGINLYNYAIDFQFQTILTLKGKTITVPFSPILDNLQSKEDIDIYCNNFIGKYIDNDKVEYPLEDDLER